MLKDLEGGLTWKHVTRDDLFEVTGGQGNSSSDPAIRTRVWGHLPQFTYDLYLFWKTSYNSTLNNYHLLTVWPYPSNLSNRLTGQYGRSHVLTFQFASAGLYCPHNSCRWALEEQVSQNGHLPQNSCRGRPPIEGAVSGPPALLTPHRPRSPQQRAVQSQSAFASAAVRHHAGPEIPPPGNLPPPRARFRGRACQVRGLSRSALLREWSFL